MEKKTRLKCSVVAKDFFLNFLVLMLSKCDILTHTDLLNTDRGIDLLSQLKSK